MPLHYSEDFKKEVVKAYMAGDKSIQQLAGDFNIAKSSVSKWVSKYKEECLYTTNTTAETNEVKEIRRLNRLLNEKVILHSDQGVQFTSWEFVSFCKDNNVTQRMSKAGCPYDNAPMERFYNTFKSNFYNVTLFSNVEMMDELTAKYINRYNYVRPHSYNNYLTPMEARYRQIFIEQSVTKKLDQYRGHFGADRSALAKLETLADEKFGQQELYLDFDI